MISRRYLLWGAVAASVLLALPVGGDLRADPKFEPRFDHAKHQEHSPECTACHKMSARTRWKERFPAATGRGFNEHRPCSNAGCHAEEWGRRDRRFCTVCHVGSLRNAYYPPYRTRGGSDFWLARFSHAEHTNSGARGCEQCHSPARQRRTRRGEDALAREKQRPAHETCGAAICHGEKVEPNMSDCSTCHVLRGDEQVEPSAFTAWDNYRVAYAFDHGEHAQRAGENKCESCHTNVSTEAGRQVPLPPMVACESCHDGHRSFDALGTQCMSCHLVPEDRR